MVDNHRLSTIKLIPIRDIKTPVEPEQLDILMPEPVELDHEWKQYLCMHQYGSTKFPCDITPIDPSKESGKDLDAPTALLGKVNEDMELLISTKTKVLFLNQPMDIHRMFWEIPIIDYWIPTPGVLKKQIKVVSKTPEEYEEYKARLTNIRYYKENIIKQIHNPSARSIKFKDERKITVGISRKDLTSYRTKVKNAFYNCFALIVRFQYDDEPFKEAHIKVFNTGKMEIPGIVNYKILEKVKSMILEILQPHIPADKQPLDFIENSHEDHVLINSNFNCGFFVNREKFHSILCGEKYRIESSYDPCSYPGVKCKFYFNNSIGFDRNLQNGRVLPEDRQLKLSELIASNKYTEISFMVFRTGSGLIVANCTEKILRFVFEFIKQILIAEYENICILSENPVIKNKQKKIRKRMITFSDEICS
jgi:hypothetical protein